MKSCIGCKYVKWALTEKGRLHPQGGGKCTYEVKPPALPASMYFKSADIGGGWINRHDDPKVCQVYEKEIKK